MSIVTVNLFIYALEVRHAGWVGAFFLGGGTSNVSDKKFLKIIPPVILAKYTVILNSDSADNLQDSYLCPMVKFRK